MIELEPVIDMAESVVANHQIGDSGSFRRWNWDNGKGRSLEADPYGCADAANILYTIDRFPRAAATRERMLSGLQALQDPATGAFAEATHHVIHTTAHCVAAIELFYARPRHRLSVLAPYASAGALADFLAGLRWADKPWTESHKGAGVFAALALADEVDQEWRDSYFDWIDAHTDPATGLVCVGAPQPTAHAGVTTLAPHMAGTFHYFFNLEWAKRPKAHADKLVDLCLALHADGQYPFARSVGFVEVDWLFCLNRSVRQTGRRLGEARAAMAEMGERLARHVRSLDPDTDEGLNDLHCLFGMLCAFAELQQAVPGLVRTSRPLRLVLDRRPFI